MVFSDFTYPIFGLKEKRLFLVDYYLLEEVKRTLESAQRKRAKLCGYFQFKIPYRLRSLKNAAGSRRTKFLFLMSRREKNKSPYSQR